MSSEAAPMVVKGVLQAVPAPAERMVEVFVNGKAVQVPANVNIVEACRVAGEYVPTCCYHPRLQSIGKCGLCNVEVDGAKEPVLGCSAKVAAGMKIRTDTPECRNKTGLAMGRILDKVRHRQPEEFAQAPELAKLMRHAIEPAHDSSSNALEIDMTKCVECTRCVRVCKDVQGIGVWKFNDGSVVPISTVGDLPVADTACVSCGQCTSVCPSGAIAEKSRLNLVEDAIKAGKVLVATMAPAVRVAIGEEFGKAAGAINALQTVHALRKCGVHFVFDTNFTADLCIMEEGTEFATRLTSGKGPFPMFTSCCPCWINLLEKNYPQFIPNVSSCKSPQGMIGAVIKTYFAKKVNKKPEDIFHISIMPCTAKKDEIVRPDLGRENYRDIDYVMTTRECAKFFKSHGINEFEESSAFDPPLGLSTGAAVIFGVTGGVMEAVLRTAADKVDGCKELVTPQMQACRGFDGIKSTFISVAGHRLQIGIIHGLNNAKRFLDELTKVGCEKSGFHLIEIMACPGGCIGGGGQPKSEDPEVLHKRFGGIYKADELCEIRKSHENPAVTELYSQFLGKPNGHLSHELLHTHYHPQHVKGLITGAPAAAAEEKGKEVVNVLYASVGGTTEGVARRVYNELRSGKVNAALYAMDQCTPADLLTSGTALLFTCTFGDGEHPAMAAKVWEFLESQQKGALKGLTYAVFGLGSSKYSHFNQSGKRLDQKLEALGGARFSEFGLGDEMADDAHNTALDPWLAHVYEELGVEPPKVALVPRYRVVLGYEASRPIPPPMKTMYAKITDSHILTPKEYPRPIQFMEFDIEDTGFEYQVGDALGIHPENKSADVKKFLEWYGLSSNAVVSILPIDEAAPLPVPPCITVEHLFVRYLDIFSRPRKAFLRWLAQFATAPAEKARLELLSSKEGADELAKYFKDWPSHADILQDFPSAHPTLDFLVEQIPLIKPRLYSVASSPRYVGQKVQLVIAIPTEFKRSRGKVLGGLATSWLPGLPLGTQVAVCVHEGSLRPSADPMAPIMMCGLGTGIAPMRALLQDRLKDKAEGKSVGPALLYQACRYSNSDYVLGDELEGAKSKGVLTRRIGAFSHQDKSRFETIDLLMKEKPEDVWEFMKLPNAHYFYCGPAAFNIPANMEAAITNACVVAGKLSPADATALVERMKADGRWRVEAF